jgi:hypothetical protein
MSHHRAWCELRSCAGGGEGAPSIRSTLNFFPLVFALSFPFWLAGAKSDLLLMPGPCVSALNAL